MPADRRRLLPRAVLGGALGLLVLLVPAFTSGSKINALVTAMAIGIVALALDLLVGSTGQLSLAHAAYFGVGTFTALNLGSRGAPWPVAFAGAVLVTALVATLVGLPSLRIRGLQVAIASLAFQIFAVLVPDRFPSVKAGGRTFNRPGFVSTDGELYYFGLACLALTVVVLWRVRSTRAGRSFVAVRDVEDRAAAFGVAAGPMKLLAYALSGALVGLGGALFALQQGSISDTVTFGLQQSLTLVAIVVVGGARSAPGILAGAFAVAALPALLGNNFSLPVLGSATLGVPILFAVLLIVSIVREPEGVAGLLRRVDRSVGDVLAGRPDHPSPRPQGGESTAAGASFLRDVPRPLTQRLPVPALLLARDVGVRYGGVQALSGLDLEVRRGEIVGLIGANGAGKSTFFNAVSGLAPTTGSITFRGRELVGLPPGHRSRLGVARTFQDMGLVRGDTVRENLLLAQGWMARYPAGLGLLGLFGAVADEATLRRRADVALDLFGLAHLRGHRLGDLPYGTMRIVEIAAAVAAGPDLLLLDEASAGLTPQEAQELGDRFTALRDELGLTLVVIEHHVPLIARVCDYCYCLESGALIAEGAPAAVTTQPRVVESFLGKGSLAVTAEELAAEGVSLGGVSR
ncbi:MAG: ATP-binding cassette domain-containing protein [Actinomycetota bacterium]|nr:ATP-binding cassette domain-containing protein [Actinomycetota bacterium]